MSAKRIGEKEGGSPCTLVAVGLWYDMGIKWAYLNFLSLCDGPFFRDRLTKERGERTSPTRTSSLGI